MCIRDSAKALLCVTNSDLANLEIGLNAKLLRPDMPVILRILSLIHISEPTRPY